METITGRRGVDKSDIPQKKARTPTKVPVEREKWAYKHSNPIDANL